MDRAGGAGGGLVHASVISRVGLYDKLSEGIRARGMWRIVARDPDGNIMWIEERENIIVNQGLDHILDIVLSGGTQITSWFVMLTDGTPTIVAGDTYQSHAGWTEVVAYTEATREAWVDGGVSAQSVDNAASVASFAINGTTTVGGCALVSFATKSDSSAGKVLYSEIAFASDRALNNGDTLEVTYTQTMADDGA